MTYHAPVEDIRTALASAAGIGELIADGTLEGLDEELVASVLGEAGRFAETVLAPLNSAGDAAPARLVDGKVQLPAAWPEAYRSWREAGWAALPCPAEHGGQGLPHVVAMAAGELWNAANLGFGVCPLLTHGAVDALHLVASEELKRLYLPRMVTGEWTGTMNLTEPHAGTDLGALRTRAEPQPDGTYRLTGTKIFITYGDHEMTPNIVHTVLARLPDAPQGTRGISLFLVPKFLVNADGSLGARNGVRCVGLESKLGIHASPTCVMSYEGAVGYLVGEANRGLNHMFIMMNRARLGVGVQGVALAERATQRARAYAHERRQGRAEGTPAGEMAPIVQHPDVQRNLLTMRALTAAARAICLATARELDISERAKDPAARQRAGQRAALLTPVAKAFSTDVGVEVASLGIQVHGGMGFIETTGAAQHYRDARILPIYEGTNGVQALDLVTRKLPLEGGAVLRGYLADLAGVAAAAKASTSPAVRRLAPGLEAVNADLAKASLWLGQALAGEPKAAMAGATPYLRLLGLAAGGAYLAKAAMLPEASGGGARATSLARFYLDNIAVAAPGLVAAVVGGGPSLLEADAGLLDA